MGGEGEENDGIAYWGKYENIQSMRRMSIQRRPQKDISHTDDNNFRPSGTCPTPDLAGMRIEPCCPSVPKR